MTHARSLLAWGAAVASATVLATTAIAADEGAAAAARSAATPAAGPQIAPPSSAVQALNRGIEAYRKNNHAAAIGAFSSAVSLGGLDSAGTAKALYFRGLAYRKQGRSAQAISDLTNALWLKNGLLEAERADAIANRAAAYKDAGIADPGAPAAASAEPPAAPAPAAVAAESAKPEPKQRNAAAVLPPAPAKPAPAPVAFAKPATATVSASESTPPQRIARAPVERTDTGAAAERAPAAPPAAPAPSPAASSGSGIGSFFSNLFGGSSAQQTGAASTPTSDVTTASTGASTSATSSWNSATEVAGRQAAPRAPSGATVSAPAAPAPVSPARTAALAPARQASDALPAASVGDAYSPSAAAANAVSPGAAPPVAGNGRFRLQLAAVRSRAEAEAVAQRFTSEQGAKAGGRSPAIEEAVFGNMGKFYRVNVGPFASAAEPEKLCQTLRSSGYDCLIVGK